MACAIPGPSIWYAILLSGGHQHLLARSFYAVHSDRYWFIPLCSLMEWYSSRLAAETTGNWTIITNLGSTVVLSPCINVVQCDPGTVLGDVWEVRQWEGVVGIIRRTVTSAACSRTSSILDLSCAVFGNTLVSLDVIFGEPGTVLLGTHVDQFKLKGGIIDTRRGGNRAFSHRNFAWCRRWKRRRLDGHGGVIRGCFTREDTWKVAWWFRWSYAGEITGCRTWQVRRGFTGCRTWELGWRDAWHHGRSEGGERRWHGRRRPGRLYVGGHRDGGGWGSWGRYRILAAVWRRFANMPCERVLSFQYGTTRCISSRYTCCTVSIYTY